MHQSFPKILEERAAQYSAYMNLPEPDSGEMFFRLVRMPLKGRETIIDVNSCGFRYRVRVTRFLFFITGKPQGFTAKTEFFSQLSSPSIEISSSYLDADSSTIRLLDHLDFKDFSNDLEDDPKADHFFLFHTNSKF